MDFSKGSIYSAEIGGHKWMLPLPLPAWLVSSENRAANSGSHVAEKEDVRIAQSSMPIANFRLTASSADFGQIIGSWRRTNTHKQYPGRKNSKNGALRPYSSIDCRLPRQGPDVVQAHRGRGGTLAQRSFSAAITKSSQQR